ncbi:MAG: hypothetical protein LBV58_02085 [Acholeplasmatales bacterium]|nr:hypothetical protein [Acholeplasmatales bacterium]
MSIYTTIRQATLIRKTFEQTYNQLDKEIKNFKYSLIENNVYKDGFL